MTSSKKTPGRPSWRRIRNEPCVRLRARRSVNWTPVTFGRTETTLAETVLAELVVVSWWCNPCTCTNIPVQTVHLHALIITRRLPHKLKLQPITCNTRAGTNIPAQPVRGNLATLFLPMWGVLICVWPRQAQKR